jgi:hypothetical protein
MIHCITLHRHKDKIKEINKEKEGKLIDHKLQEFLETDENIEAFKKHKAEINTTIDKNKRVYLVHEPDFEFSGLFHSADVKRLMKIINKASTDGLDSSNQVCRLMAGGDSEDGTLKLVNDISFDKHEIPATFLLSLSNMLLNKEGVGISEVGKS